MVTRKRVSAPPITFSDEKLNRLMEYVKTLERELHKVQAVLDQGTTGQVLTKQSARTYDASWAEPSGGGGGTDADGTNLGTGEGEVFKITMAGVLQFRTLKEGTNITITQDGEEVTIAATSSISVAWSDITGRPSTFPPSAHSQAATTITYSNTVSGLTATNVQAAIDELAAGGGGSYTDEDAQDAVGSILTDTATINFTYNDIAGTITADVIDGALSINWSQLTSLPTMIDDVAALVDPNADRILFWDDSAAQIDWLTVGTGLSITGTTISATGTSPLTTKGDLFAYDTGNARLAVGADGTVLVADSSQSIGLKWISAQSSWAAGFSNDFSSNTTGWGNNGSGSWAISGGALVQSSTGATGDVFYYTTRTPYVGVRITVDVQLVSAGAGSTQVAGFWLGDTAPAATPNNTLNAALRNASGTKQFVADKFGVGTVYSRNTSFTMDVYHTLQIILIGDRTVVYLDGVAVGSYTTTDTAINAYEYFGLFAYGGQAKFQNFRLEILKESTVTPLTSPLTTKGDLFGYNTGNARIAVGSDRQCLIADSGQAAGVKWAGFSGTRVRKAAAAAISSTTPIGAALTWDTEDYDTDSYHSTSSNTSRVVAPFTGYYRMTGCINYGGGAGFHSVSIVVNGTTNIAGHYPGSGTPNQPRLFVDTTYALAAGDYVELYGFTTGGGNTQNTDGPTFFCVEYLGP